MTINVDPLTAEADSSYRTLRRVVNTIAIIVFAILLLAIGYGFYCFRVSSLDIGSHLRIQADSEENAFYTCESSPSVVIHYKGIPSNSIKVKLDEQNLKLKNQGLWGTLAGQTEELSDGPHTITVIAGHYRANWSFIVDTEKPTMDLRGPSDGFITNKDSVTFYGSTKPSARLTIKVHDQTIHHDIDEDGAFKFVVPISHGINALKWTVADRAGNSISGEKKVICDLAPPSIEPVLCSLDGEEQATPKTNGAVFTQRNLVLKLTVKDPDSGIRSTSYTLDSSAAKQLPVPSSQE
ncbi:hypothetical protein IJT17_02525, partial [bacterium]|nr:hypothetical protein [bacterium]